MPDTTLRESSVGRAVRESRVVRLFSRVRRRLGTLSSGSRLRRLRPSVTRRVRGTVQQDGEQQGDGPRGSDAAGPGRFGRSRESSVALRTVAGATAALQRAAGHSRLAGGVTATGRRYVEASWLYRWLTAEPEPDVIVIDLRETLSVGPVLLFIERVLRWLVPATASSLLFGLGRRGHRLAASRPIQLASLFVALCGLALLGMAIASPSSTPLVATSVALLMLAALGSRLTWTWAELQETRGYQVLAAALAPPEGPAPSRADDERTVGESDHRSGDVATVERSETGTASTASGTSLHVEATPRDDGTVRVTGRLATATGAGLGDRVIDLTVDGAAETALTGVDGTFEKRVAVPAGGGDWDGKRVVTVSAAYEGEDRKPPAETAVEVAVRRRGQ